MRLEPVVQTDEKCESLSNLGKNEKEVLEKKDSNVWFGREKVVLSEFSHLQYQIQDKNLE